MAFSGLGLALLMAQVDPASLVPLYRQALTIREQQFGPKHPKVARASSDLGLYLLEVGEREQAVAALRRALAIDRETYPANHATVAEDLENLAGALPPSPEAAALLEQAATCTDPRIAARAASKLGNLEEQARRNGMAIAAYRRALALEETATRLNDLALLLEPKPAEPLLRKALAMRQRDSGARHPETAVAMNNLANVLLALGKAMEAERLQRAALASLEAALGQEHPRVAVSCVNLAEVLRAKGDAAGAKAMYRRALAIEHPGLVDDMASLADYLDELGEKAEAAKLRRRAEAIKAGVK